VKTSFQSYAVGHWPKISVFCGVSEIGWRTYVGMLVYVQIDAGPWHHAHVPISQTKHEAELWRYNVIEIRASSQGLRLGDGAMSMLELIL